MSGRTAGKKGRASHRSPKSPRRNVKGSTSRQSRSPKAAVRKPGICPVPQVQASANDLNRLLLMMAKYKPWLKGAMIAFAVLYCLFVGCVLAMLLTIPEKKAAVSSVVAILALIELTIMIVITFYYRKALLMKVEVDAQIDQIQSQAGQAGACAKEIADHLVQDYQETFSVTNTRVLGAWGLVLAFPILIYTFYFLGSSLSFISHGLETILAIIITVVLIGLGILWGVLAVDAVQHLYEVLTCDLLVMRHPGRVTCPNWKLH